MPMLQRYTSDQCSQGINGQCGTDLDGQHLLQTPWSMMASRHQCCNGTGGQCFKGINVQYSGGISNQCSRGINGQCSRGINIQFSRGIDGQFSGSSSAIHQSGILYGNQLYAPAVIPVHFIHPPWCHQNSPQRYTNPAQ